MGLRVGEGGGVEFGFVEVEPGISDVDVVALFDSSIAMTGTSSLTTRSMKRAWMPKKLKRSQLIPPMTARVRRSLVYERDCIGGV